MTNGPGLARTREAQADALASLATALADDTTPGPVERQCQVSAESAVNDQPESDTVKHQAGQHSRPQAVPSLPRACPRRVPD